MNVTNEEVSERIIGMTFGQKRDYWVDWRLDNERRINRGLFPVLFRTWMFDKAEQIILSEADAWNRSARDYTP